jgi:hypothetical protein
MKFERPLCVIAVAGVDRGRDGSRSPPRERACPTAPASSASKRMIDVVYDAAVLIAADRNVRRVWADHKARLEAGVVPLVPAAVLAQVSRSGRQAQMRRLLRGCIVVALDEASAHAAGRLLGRARTADVVDASVVTLAVAQHASIATGDPDDIDHLVRAAGVRIPIVVI